MVDWAAIQDDPCALLNALRPILYARMAGGSAGGQVVETQHTDTRTRYAEGMSVRELAAEVRRLQDLCTIQQGGASTRKVIIAG
jgi:hypothetical protein